MSWWFQWVRAESAQRSERVLALSWGTVEFRVNVSASQLPKGHEDLRCVVPPRCRGVSPELSSGGCSVPKKQRSPLKICTYSLVLEVRVTAYRRAVCWCWASPLFSSCRRHLRAGTSCTHGLQVWPGAPGRWATWLLRNRPPLTFGREVPKQ